VEAVLLDRHRQAVRHRVDGADVGELAHERADGQLDATGLRDRRGPCSTRDHERLG
jgi:hypothetical protein